MTNKPKSREFKMVMDNSIRNLEKILNADSNVIFAFIFGSTLLKKTIKPRDLDLAVYFQKPPEGMELLSLANRLSETASIEVHLTVLNTASSFLRHQVMKKGIPFILKDKDTYRIFREKTITDYDEYKFVSGMNIYDR